MIDTVLVGRQIRAARIARGVTMEALAEKIGLATASLGHIECGVRAISLSSLEKIADELEVSFDYLMGRTSDFRQNSMLIEIEELGADLTPKQFRVFKGMMKAILPYVRQLTSPEN